MPPCRPVAFVSGGGSGIGRASALALARAGHAVMVADADAESARSVAKEVCAMGGQAISAETDVSSEEAVRSAVEATRNEFGGLHAAVNSAGIQGQLGPLDSCTLDNWERTIAVNLTGVFLCMREQVRAMLGNDDGSTQASIVNISSNFGLVGKKNISAYCASKHGIIGLTKTAALDYAERGIRVNAVCPGPTVTPMFDKIMSESGEQARTMLQEVEASVPMGRLGDVGDVAAAVAWLCSDASAFVTGAAMPVDGGFVIGR